MISVAVLIKRNSNSCMSYSSICGYDLLETEYPLL